MPPPRAATGSTRSTGLIGPLTRRQVVVLGAGALIWLLASISVPSEWLLGRSPLRRRGGGGGAAVRRAADHRLDAGVVRLDVPGPLGPPLGAAAAPHHRTCPPTQPGAAAVARRAAHRRPPDRAAGRRSTTPRPRRSPPTCRSPAPGSPRLSPDQMDFLLSGWGQVFGAVPADDGLVRITWSDIARRVPLVGHDDWAAGHARPARRRPGRVPGVRRRAASRCATTWSSTITVQVASLRGADGAERGDGPAARGGRRSSPTRWATPGSTCTVR